MSRVPYCMHFKFSTSVSLLILPSLSVRENYLKLSLYLTCACTHATPTCVYDRWVELAAHATRRRTDPRSRKKKQTNKIKTIQTFRCYGHSDVPRISKRRRHVYGYFMRYLFASAFPSQFFNIFFSFFFHSAPNE